MQANVDIDAQVTGCSPTRVAVVTLRIIFSMHLIDQVGVLMIAVPSVFPAVGWKVSMVSLRLTDELLP